MDDEVAAVFKRYIRNGDGMLEPMTTKAQAEGAIDGSYTDYMLLGATSTAFRFSRYVLPRHAAQSSERRVASTGEWDGVAGSLRRNFQTEL